MKNQAPQKKELPKLPKTSARKDRSNNNVMKPPKPIYTTNVLTQQLCILNTQGNNSLRKERKGRLKSYQGISFKKPNTTPVLPFFFSLGEGEALGRSVVDEFLWWVSGMRLPLLKDAVL